MDFTVLIAAAVFGIDVALTVKDWKLMKSEMPERSFISKDNLLVAIWGLCSIFIGISLYVVIEFLLPIEKNYIAEAVVLAGMLHIVAGIVTCVIGTVWFVVNLVRRSV